MIVEVAAIVCTSVVAVVTVTLVFVKTIQDREAKLRPKPGTVIHPFRMQKTCFLCGAAYQESTLGHDSKGPSQPETCHFNTECAAYPEEHLHVYCGSCHSQYFMEPRLRDGTEEDG